MLKRIFAAMSGLTVAAALVLAAPAQAATAEPPRKPVLYEAGQAQNRLLTSPEYRYAGGKVTGITGHDGMRSTMTIEQPYLEGPGAGYHSLMELAAIKSIVPSTGGAAQRNIVEIGWTVDRALNGGSVQPHLFVFAWKNGTGLGYNAAGGFVDNGTCSVNAGDNVSVDVGTQRSFILQYKTLATATVEGWWAWYGNSAFTTGCWVGHWPATIWTTGSPTVTGFTGPDEAQWFGEAVVDSLTGTQCTDMGDGTFGSTWTAPISQASDPAWVSSARLTNLATLTSPTLVPFQSHASAYDASAFSATTVLMGGPGNGGVTGGC